MMGRRRSEDEDKEEEGKQEDECSAPLSESSTDEKDGNNQFFQLFRCSGADPSLMRQADGDAKTEFSNC